MSSTITSLPNVIDTRLNYYLELDKGGSAFVYPGTAGEKLRKFNTVECQIVDMRSTNETFTLDANGFQLVQHHSKEQTFDDDVRVKDLVYRETAEMLRVM